MNEELDLDFLSRRVESEIAGLVLHQPLYGSVFLHLTKVMTTTVTETMAVGLIRRIDLALYWNPKFVAELTQCELRAVLIHEVLHILLHHVTRPKSSGYENVKAWGIAADLAINSYIEGLPSGVFYPNMFKLKSKQSADFYYEALKHVINDDDGIKTVDDHSLWGGMNSAIVNEKIADIADKAIKAQGEKGWSGSCGLEIKELVGAAKDALVSWKKVFRYFFHQAVLFGRERTRSRPNRRYGWFGQGTKRSYASKILVAIDTSGSMSIEDISEICTEIDAMQEYAMIDMVQFDTELKGIPLAWELWDREIVGRGGTSFFPVMDLIAKSKYDGLVVCTDGGAKIPPEPLARVMWVVPEKYHDKEFGYGKKVVIRR